MPSIKDLLNIYGVRAKSNLSQNFLMKNWIAKELVARSNLGNNETVIEVGPGPGNLTRQILMLGPKQLYVIEKDRRFLPMLEMLADAALPGQMKVVIGDIRDLTLGGFLDPSLRREWQKECPPIHIIGNLPFNVSTALLIKWLNLIHSQSGIFEYGRVQMNLTFQIELVDRITSDVMEPSRNRLSVMVQLFCHAKKKMTIYGHHFMPKALVDTGLIQFTPLRRPLVPPDIPFKYIEKFVRIMYHIRAKPLRIPCRILFPRKNHHLINEMFRSTCVSMEDSAMMLSCAEVAEVLKSYWNIVKDEPVLRDYNHTYKEPIFIKDLFSESGRRYVGKKPKPREPNLNE